MYTLESILLGGNDAADEVLDVVYFWLKINTLGKVAFRFYGRMLNDDSIVVKYGYYGKWGHKNPP